MCILKFIRLSICRANRVWHIGISEMCVGIRVRVVCNSTSKTIDKRRSVNKDYCFIVAPRIEDGDRCPLSSVHKQYWMQRRNPNAVNWHKDDISWQLCVSFLLLSMLLHRLYNFPFCVFWLCVKVASCSGRFFVVLLESVLKLVYCAHQFSLHFPFAPRFLLISIDFSQKLLQDVLLCSYFYAGNEVHHSMCNLYEREDEKKRPIVPIECVIQKKRKNTPKSGFNSHNIRSFLIVYLPFMRRLLNTENGFFSISRDNLAATTRIGANFSSIYRCLMFCWKWHRPCALVNVLSAAAVIVSVIDSFRMNAVVVPPIQHINLIHLNQNEHLYLSRLQFQWPLMSIEVHFIFGNVFYALNTTSISCLMPDFV